MNGNVYVMVHGRLGNNLFQIGLGLTYAKRYEKSLRLVVKDSWYDPRLSYPHFFEKYDFESLDDVRFGDKTEFVKESRSFDAVCMNGRDGDVVFDGYFQSESYMDCDAVRTEFELDASIREFFVEKYDGIEDAVGISIRRGDYLGLRHIFNVLGPKYYEDVYNRFFEGRRCFISSDDIPWCRSNVKIPNAVYITEHDDMTLMALSLCKHHILSNSTFSWWCAWLREREDSVNVATKRWFTDSCGIRDTMIIPSRWTLVDFADGYLI